MFRVLFFISIILNLSANTQTLKSLSINNGGERVEDSTHSISYTIGQTNVGTLNNYEFIRMGFQQPSFRFTVVGCTDSTAFNYNPLATSDDSSCVPVIYGCTDSLAVNFNPFANTDDSTCCGASYPLPFGVQIGSTIYGQQYYQSGEAVSISDDGSIVAVGSFNANNWNGKVSIYENINGNWIQLGQDLFGTHNSYFGKKSVFKCRW